MATPTVEESISKLGSGEQIGNSGVSLESISTLGALHKMDTLDIESGPTPAVKNLLSKFESLAVDNAAPASTVNRCKYRPRYLQLESCPRLENVTSNTTSRPFSHSPKPSISSMTNPPLVPPRILTPSEPLISFESPEDYHSHSSSSNSVSDLDDPFTEDTTESSTDDPDSSTTAVAPPLPARKHHRYHHQQESNSSCSQGHLQDHELWHYLSLNAPPPLPVRRSTVAQAEDLAASPKTPRPSTSARLAPPPPHSSHPSPNHLARVSLDLDHPPSSAPTTSERKTFGKHPPLPTRTIALGDKLPPKRPTTTEGVTIGDSDDDESGDEDDVKGSGVDLLPDATRASRRPPYLMTPRDRDSGVYPAQPCKITVPAHAGHLPMSGEHVIVGSTYHIRFYNINLSQELPSKSMDTKDFGIKDGKVMAVEFKTEFLVWIALKEGHIFEIDVRNGDLLGVKHCAHMIPILYLFRYAGSMISIDEVGKVLIWSPDPATGDIKLLHHTPRVMRITDKLDFAKIIGGVLWTAGRSEQHGAGTLARTPIIRMYDLFNPASTGKTVMPTEHVGPVTSATIIPSDPGHVYVGHEEGFITIWALEDADSSGGYPKCIEVMKVASTDVTSLEGINDRLWAAHPGLPVLQISADPFGVEKYKRLGVVSVGRDERVGLWDGLLALDWQDTEVQKHEQSYSSFRDLKVLIISWNCDSAKPDSLHGHSANINFFHDVLNSEDRPDIISFGFQEVIDLESRKMAAKNMLMAARTDARSRRDEGTLLGLSDKVTGAYKRWFDALMLAVKLAMPPDCPYSVVHTESMVGLFTCVMVKNTEKAAVRDVAINTVKRGMGGRYGNKGGILSRFLIDDSSLCFVNCHLAAGQDAVRARNADAAGMLEQQFLFPAAGERLAFVGGGDGSMVLDHEIVFINGDMNYRIAQRRDAITAAVRANEHESLFAHDQLLKEIRYNRACRFRFFTEGPIAFAPTYKYDRRSDVYDTSEKRRAPAWCDRVLWRSRVPSRVKQLHYQRYEVNVSDHRPISAAFNITVKRTRHEIREKKKAEV
ncbi:Endonuclease/exonuclease/phosphatase [Lentinula detonsa]|uniref:Endonuclease/exonuclease/phosphatase n=2 Tax=Lentinula detonsa TaxID=2804962 RepID=A0A9W8TS49_9AGAR|nr:Endonuclease/exonuclease/phosphatase [Lentinula detonsa]